MNAKPPPEDHFSVFRERYATADSDVARKVEQEVFGHSGGIDGWTTVEQAGALVSALEVGPLSTVLDLGAGRGWLAAHVAAASGCRVVSSDIPTDALGESRDRFSAQGLIGRATTIAADARAVPLRGQTIDGVVHSDVFC